MARATVFHRDPAAQAQAFEAQGFEYLHVVDLDGAFAGEAVSIPVIASVGLASLDDVRALLAPRAKKLAGAIAGRALYDGRLDAAAALALIRGARQARATGQPDESLWRRSRKF